jgi:methylmalonyl-CoA/ethylmalonyl-CoA epimerase
MNAPVKSDNPNVIGLKHMAFAVKDAKAALATYARFLCVPADSTVHEYAKSRNRVAIFDLGGIEYQLCESMDSDGRFASWIRERGGEGLHHICYAVDSIDNALAHAQEHGARLRMCKSCGVAGSHPHPEGYVAFLDNDAGGIEIEFMQVYTPAELEKYNAVKGI